MPQCVQNTFKNDLQMAANGQCCAAYRRREPAYVSVRPRGLEAKIQSFYIWQNFVEICFLHLTNYKLLVFKWLNWCKMHLISTQRGSYRYMSNRVQHTWSETYFRQDLFPSYLFFRRQFHASVNFRLKSSSGVGCCFLLKLEFTQVKIYSSSYLIKRWFPLLNLYLNLTRKQKFRMIISNSRHFLCTLYFSLRLMYA